MRNSILDKYKPASPQLDRIRRDVIAAELGEGETVAPGFWPVVWRELFVIPRKAWAGIGAAWLVVLILNGGNEQEPPSPMAARWHAPEQEVVQRVHEQQHLRAELLGKGMATVELSPADRPREGYKPRSQRRDETAMV